LDLPADVIGFFASVLTNFNSLAQIVFQSFSSLGLKAAGSGLSSSDFLQPGKLAQVGLDAGRPILTAAGQLMCYVSFFQNFVLMISWLIVLMAFFVLAVQLFISLIEFKLTTLTGFVLIPFALFNKTAFLAEKVLGNVVASGVKILARMSSIWPPAKPSPGPIPTAGSRRFWLEAIQMPKIIQEFRGRNTYLSRAFRGVS